MLNTCEGVDTLSAPASTDQKTQPCPTVPTPMDIAAYSTNNAVPTCGELVFNSELSFSFENTDSFISYKNENLVLMHYPPEPTMILNPHPKWTCSSYSNPHISQSQDCFAVAFSQSTKSSYNLIRFNKAWKLKRRLNTDNDEPAGFFKKPSHDMGRARLREKMGPFIENLSFIESLFKETLTAHNLHAGSDIVLMVVNEGEIDMILNFACSSRFHNISLSNVVVVSASEEIIPVIKSVGYE